MPADPIYCPPKALVIDRENAHRAYWLCLVSQAHSPEDVQSPHYFGMLASKLKVGDVIEVSSEDQSWYGELMVRAIPGGINQVRTALRFITYFEGEELPEGWDIKYLGGVSKHVIFKGDQMLDGGFSTREEAEIKVFALAKREEESLAVVAPVAERKKPGPKPKPVETPPPA